MNIRFLSIELENFRSIDRIKVELANKGTVIVKGINEYEEKATSNGSGKSSIFEGIIYALFEETSSGEKDVENRIKQEGFEVNLKFEIDNIQYEIIRQGKKGKTTVVLLKDGIDISARNKTDTNKLIQSILMINKSIFLDSIFLSQNAVTNLASLAPTARRERLETLTNTSDNINSFKEDLKNKLNILENDLNEYNMSYSKLIGMNESYKNQIMNLQVKLNNLENEFAQLNSINNLESIETEIKNINETEIPSKEAQIKEIENAITQIDENIKDQYNKIEFQNQSKQQIETQKQEKLLEWNNLNNKQLQNNSNINNINNQIKHFNDEINNIKNSEICPTCGRKYDNLNEDHIKSTIDNLLSQIDEAKKEIDNILNINQEIETDKLQIQQEGQNLNKSIQDFDNIINNIKLDITKLENNKNEENDNKSNIKSEISNYQNRLRLLNEEKDKLLNSPLQEINNIKENISNLQKESDSLQDQINLKQKSIESCNKTIVIIKNCIQLVTKDYRTYLLQNSLKYLNELLSNYSKRLFSNEKDLIYIEEADSKLNIFLGKATYESLSGGERTRVNIALLLAQKSLANMIGNINCNLIILDEILGYCDGQAENVVIDLITEELDALETIFMISHKEIPIGYDSELVIVKDKKGLSRLRIC